MNDGLNCMLYCTVEVCIAAELERCIFQISIFLHLFLKVDAKNHRYVAEDTKANFPPSLKKHQLYLPAE